jgi:hypothetical protein
VLWLLGTTYYPSMLSTSRRGFSDSFRVFLVSWVTLVQRLPSSDQAGIGVYRYLGFLGPCK